MKRIRDDHSGSSAANWPASTSAAPPGAHRPASPRELPVDAAPEGLRGLGRAPGQVDDDPAGPSGSRRRVRARIEPTAIEPTNSLPGISEVVPDEIATRLDPRSRAMLASSNRTLRHSLREFSISDNVVAQGRQVGSLEALGTVLRDVQSPPLSERPNLQTRPLAVLAGRVRTLPSAERQPAFDAILATIMQAPAAYRHPMDAPLMMLAEQVPTLPVAQWEGAVRQLLNALVPSSGLDADQIHLMADQVEGMTEAARPQVFMQLVQRAERLEPDLREGMAGALARKLEFLPEAAREPAFSELLKVCNSLAPEQRAEPLTQLTHAITDLSEADRLAAVKGILAAAESLAPAQRWAVLKPLGQEVYLLPPAEQPSTWQGIVRSVLAVPPTQLAAALEAMANQIKEMEDDENLELPQAPLRLTVLQESLAWLEKPGECLPLEAHNAIVQVLADDLGTLPEAERQAGFQGALNSIEQRPQEHRSPLLAVLARAIGALPEAARQPMWQAALKAALQGIRQSPLSQDATPLPGLAVQMSSLPTDESKEAAFGSLLEAHRMMPEQYKGSSLDALGTGCLALPRAQWPHALGQVLAESARVAEEPRYMSMLRLVIKFHQAAPAAHGPVVPRQVDNGQPDVRIQCVDRVLESMPQLSDPSPVLLERVNEMKSKLEQALQQRQQPGEAAFMNKLLERLRQLTGA